MMTSTASELTLLFPPRITCSGLRGWSNQLCFNIAKWMKQQNKPQSCVHSISRGSLFQLWMISDLKSNSCSYENWSDISCRKYLTSAFEKKCNRFIAPCFRKKAFVQRERIPLKQHKSNYVAPKPISCRNKPNKLHTSILQW
jgi:hypothetical protein